jgi:hypothetical protein
MTGPDDSYSNTRPISVAELLAKNGTIGAPPVGGRRRRRRGNTDSVTVAELTGEIPIIRQDQVEDLQADEDEDEDQPVETASRNGRVETVEVAEPDAIESEDTDTDVHGAVQDIADEDVDDDYADAVADYTAHLEERNVDPDPVDFFAPTRRPQFSATKRRDQQRSDAEQMSPDPFGEDDDADHLIDSSVDLVQPLERGHADATDLLDSETEDDDDDDEVPSYLRSTAGPLFGGQTVADDIARRGFPSSEDDTDLDEESETAAPSVMSSFLRGAWVVGQCIIAVAFGAGLFIAFDQLWKWNNIVALVLSVLVILGLVVGVRVVRKTEDIGSTLIAVAVGALVTLGPLALLQSG